MYGLTPLIFIVALVCYLGGNHLLPITDPVESNYALTAKEMVLSGNFLSPQIYGHFWYDKPILIYWLIAFGYKMFGFADWVARMPSGVFAALSLAMLYQGIRRSSGRWHFALLTTVILGSSLMFWIVAHGIITDMLLLFATVGTMVNAYSALVEGRKGNICWAYAYAAIGVLAKGPVALVLPGLLLLIFAATQRSWSMVRTLFDWRGILVFLSIGSPWYVYMYLTHGQAFIDGFIGLNNVTRALSSEHPRDNYWWYYLTIFIGASLPWTGAVIYGMVAGWKRCHPAYVYNMIFGIGTIVFYSLMATKYPLYTFISLVPFSVIAAIGTVKMLRSNVSRIRSLCIVIPTLLLWALYCVATFYVKWGFWVLLYVLVGIMTLILLRAWWAKHQYVLPIVIGVGTMLISSVVVLEGLVPFVQMRSSTALVPIVQEFKGDLYYYNDYSTSLVYYTGRPMDYITAGKDGKEKRSSAWSGKYLMPRINQYDVKFKQPSLIFVKAGDLDIFQESPLYKTVTLYKTVPLADQKGIIYVYRGEP